MQIVNLRKYQSIRVLTWMLAINLAIGCSSSSTDNTADPAPTVSLSTSATSIASGATVNLTWSSTNADSCTASGAWSGNKNTSGSENSGSLVAASNIFQLSCSGSGGSAQQSVTVTVGSSTSAPTVTISPDPATIPSGSSAMLTWSTTNATTCVASGAWSGSRPTSGSTSTGPLTQATNVFSLACTGAGGSTSRSTTVTVTDSGAVVGLDFPGSAATTGTIRFKFENPLAIFPATYIWKAFPRQQSGYYTTFFWGNDDGAGNINTFLWKPGGGADSYYGTHPYPQNPPDGNTHFWEVSVEQRDYVNGVVVYDRWYTQALRVWADADGKKHHEFYWDLPNTDASHVVSRTSPATWGNDLPPSPTLTWGDAPWAPSNEIWNGVLRGIQIYSKDLSIDEIQAEANQPLSTTAGAANIWYMNINITPGDISDKSGAGNNPVWVGNERPALWQGP